MEQRFRVRMKDQKLGSGLARNQDFVKGRRLESKLTN